MRASHCSVVVALAAALLSSLTGSSSAGAAMAPAVGFTAEAGSWPVAAANPDGVAAVAFSAGSDVKAAVKPTASAFLAPQTLGAGTLPAVAVAADGTVAVAWSRSGWTDVAVRPANSDEFGAVRSVASLGLVNVAFAPSGRLYVATASDVFTADTPTAELTKVLSLQRSTSTFPPSLAVDTDDGSVVVAGPTADASANADVAILKWTPGVGAAAPIVVPGERPTDGRSAMAWQFAGVSAPEPVLYWTRWVFCNGSATPCGFLGGDATLTRWTGGVKKDLSTVSGPLFGMGPWLSPPVSAVNASGSIFSARAIAGNRALVTAGSTTIDGYLFSRQGGWWDVAAPTPLNDAFGSSDFGPVTVAPFAEQNGFSVYAGKGTTLLRRDINRTSSQVDTVATEASGFFRASAVGTGFGDELVAYGTGTPQTVHVISEDLVAPELTVAVPASGDAGLQRLAVRVSDWSATTVRWQFADGSSATGEAIDRVLPEGKSTITVTATDAAGHVASRVFTVTRTAPAAGAGAGAASAGSGNAGGGSTWPAGRLVVTAPRGTQSRGSAVKVAGRVIADAGTPVAGATVVVRGRRHVSGAPWEPRPSVVADASGAFSVPVPTGSSYDLRLEYVHRGGVATAVVSVAVRAKLSITPVRQRVARFGRMRLGGRLGVDGLSKRGAYIDVQLLQRGTWRTVGTARTNRQGAWSWSYPLASGVRTSYRFRAKLRPAADVPSAATTSRTVRVDVR